jgi:transketolase
VAYYRFHSGAPDAAGYTRAAEELIGTLNAQCDALGLRRLAFETVQAKSRASVGPQQALIHAYAETLVDEMRRTPELMVLDADLAVDIGIQPAREAFPERFIECGIAEMDMVSMAGGLARGGLLPVCHSFACFLGTRANEHVYNNATEQARIVYVASLAGLLPGGPGHSHQSVRDISAVGGVPGLVALSPSSEHELRLALGWALHEHGTASYLRLESVPCTVPYQLPANYRLELGVGCQLRAGRDALFIGYGPVLLGEAWRAAERLAESGLSVGLVNLPWLNVVDEAWLRRLVAGVPHLFSLDNHLLVGGQGDRLANALASAGFRDGPRLHRFAVEAIPVCGNNLDVLRHHRLDAQSLSERVLHVLRG